MPEADQQYEFGGLLLEPRTEMLSLNGSPVEIQPLSFKLLLHLIEHRERLVPRDELVELLWGGIAIGRGSLDRAMRGVRRALDEADSESEWIRTQYGVGYQFVHAVSLQSNSLRSAWEDDRLRTPPLRGSSAQAQYDRGLERIRRLIGLGELRTALDQAAETEIAARELGDSHLIELALEASLMPIIGGYPYYQVIALLEEAKSRVTEDDPANASRIHAQLAYHLHYNGDGSEQFALAERAVELARTAGDDSALSQALWILSGTLFGAQHCEAILASLEESAEAAARAADAQRWTMARMWRIATLARAGRRDEIERSLDELDAKLSPVPDGQLLMQGWRAMTASLDEEHERAEALAREVLVEYERRDDAANFQRSLGLLHQVLRARKKDDEIITVLDELAERYPAAPILRAAASATHAAAGRLDEARIGLDLIAGKSLHDMPRDRRWFGAIAMSVEPCVAVGDRTRARELTELLQPLSGMHAEFGLFYVYLGPVDLLLGDLAKFLGDHARASHHYRRAESQAQDMGAPAFERRAAEGPVRL